MSLLTYLREVCKPDESDVLIVFREQSGMPVLQNVERYSDARVETITRARGGIVHNIMTKRHEYVTNNHFILPIKNLNGQARFMYKSNIGQTILQNLKVHAPTN